MRACARSLASTCLEKYPILKAVRHTETANLDLLTGSIELANADVALCGLRGRELAVEALETSSRNWGWNNYAIAPSR